MNLGEWLHDATERLQVAGVPEARTDAQLLAACALGQSRAWVLAHPEAPVPANAERLLRRREAREPLAYLLGRREFRTLSFAVTPAVLIPRQETEVLVELAIDLAPLGARVLDLGTGCGCIAISLAVERPDLRVMGSDLSPEALEVARGNARQQPINVAWLLADGVPNEAFDVIVCNPPYVPPGTPLQPEIARYEPAGAVFGTDSDGLGFYRRVAKVARGHTRWLLLELGMDQESAVREILAVEGWVHLETRPDLAGIPRAIAVQAT